MAESPRDSPTANGKRLVIYHTKIITFPSFSIVAPFVWIATESKAPIHRAYIEPPSGSESKAPLSNLHRPASSLQRTPFTIGNWIIRIYLPSLRPALFRKNQKSIDRLLGESSQASLSSFLVAIQVHVSADLFPWRLRTPECHQCLSSTTVKRRDQICIFVRFCIFSGLCIFVRFCIPVRLWIFAFESLPLHLRFTSSPLHPRLSFISVLLLHPHRLPLHLPPICTFLGSPTNCRHRCLLCFWPFFNFSITVSDKAIRRQMSRRQVLICAYLNVCRPVLLAVL